MARAVTLSDAQNAIFQKIAQYIAKPSESINGNVFMVQGAAGTGKTVLLNQILSHCLNQNVKTIALAYTGIASSLFPKGKTVHSLFRIPWNQQVSCAIEPNYSVYKSIKKASVLVWDQATFCSRQIIEEVNGFLQNMMNTKQLFGGKIVVFGADCFECAPIVMGKQNDPPESHSILFSGLFGQMQRFHLKDNHRFPSAADFQWCMEIGSGLRSEIFVPAECRVHDIDALIHSIYGQGYIGSMSMDDLMNRSIFTVLAEDVDILNTKCLNQLFPSKFICHSINYFRKIDREQRSRFYNMENVMENLPKYFPADVLHLSVNCPIILTQSYLGLAVGTRLIVKSIEEKRIVAEIGVGHRKGKNINIYRTFTKKTFRGGNVEFIRRQFPVALAFSITINKALGLEFKRAGVWFPCRVFSHGQLYVAFSRVPDIQNNLKVLVNCNQFSFDRLPNVINPNITNFALPI